MIAQDHAVEFIGRQDELECVKRLFDAGAAAVLCVRGPGGIGKTRFLQEIVAVAHAVGNTLVTEVLDFDMLHLHVGDSLLRAVAAQFGRQDDHFAAYWKALEQLAGEEQRQDALSDEIMLLQEKALQVFEECYKELARGRRLLILLDTLEKALGADVEAEIVRLVNMVAATETLIVLSGRSERVEEDWQRLLRRVEGVPFQLMELPPLDEAESLRYVDEKEQALHIAIAPAIRLKLVRFAGGWPMLIDLVCEWVARDLLPAWLIEAPVEQLAELAREQREEIEASLVQPIHALPTTLNRIVLYMAHVYPLREQIWSSLLEVDSDEHATLSAELQRLVFVKVLPDGSYTLHDEMRRMVEKYVWDDIDRAHALRTSISTRMTAYYAEQAQRLHAQLERRTGEAVDLPLAGAILSKELEQQYWLCRAQQLRHQCQSDIEQGYSLFEELFAAADRQHQWRQWEALIEQIWPFKELLDATRQYSVEIKRINYLLSGERLSATDSTRAMLLAMRERFDDDGHRTVEMLSKLFSLMNQAGRFAEAVSYVQEALAICERKLPDLVAQFNNNLGQAYRSLGELELARQAYREALKQPPQLEEALSDVYNNLGFVECLLGEYNRARVHCEDALETRKDLLWRSQRTDERNRLELKIGLSYSTLSDLCRFTGDYGEARRWIELAIDKFEAKRSRRKQATAYTKLGAILSNTARDAEDYARAEAILKKALDLGGGKEEPHALHVLGCVYRDQGELDRALELFQKSEQRAQAQHTPPATINNLLAMADIAFRRWQEHHEPQYREQMLALVAELEAVSRENVRLFHHYARMERLLGDLAFEEERYDDALKLYARAFGRLGGRRGGYGRRTFADELVDLGARIERLPPLTALAWCSYLEQQWSDPQQNALEPDELLRQLSAFRRSSRRRLARSQ